jgi:flagellar basal body-associated protein FliL
MRNSLKLSRLSSGKAIMVILSILILILLGVAGFFAYRYQMVRKSLENQTYSLQESTENSGDPSSEKSFVRRLSEEKAPVFEKIGDFVVNLKREPGLSNYVLQINLEIQLYSEAERTQIASYLPKIRSEVLHLLGSKKYDELNTAEGKKRLAREIDAVIENTVNKKDSVYEVLFTSFIIQEQ